MADNATKGIVEIRCETWLDFLTEVEKRRSTRGAFYRGHREACWRTESTLLRETRRHLLHSHPDWNDQQLGNVLQRKETSNGGKVMQSYASHFEEREGTELTDRRLFMMGRHQGLLTPFVDWTRSPFIAAFFGAVEVVELLEQNSGRDFAILQVSSWLFPFELDNRTCDNEQLKRHALQVNAAYFGNQRGIAQRGVATYLHPQTDIESFVLEVAAESDTYDQALLKFIIPHSRSEDALNNLHQMNINYVTLFPDPYGLAKQANLNLYMHLEGMGNWMKPPGFETLMPANDNG